MEASLHGCIRSARNLWAEMDQGRKNSPNARTLRALRQHHPGMMPGPFSACRIRKAVAVRRLRQRIFGEAARAPPQPNSARKPTTLETGTALTTLEGLPATSGHFGHTSAPRTKQFELRIRPL